MLDDVTFLNLKDFLTEVFTIKLSIINNTFFLFFLKRLEIKLFLVYEFKFYIENKKNIL